MSKKSKPMIRIIQLEPEDGPKKRKPSKNQDQLELPPELQDFDIIGRLDEDLITEKEWVPVTSKTRWECMKCGWCCTHSWRINLTWKEYNRIKDKLTVNQVVIDEETGMSHPVYTIVKQCERYDTKTHLCTIYKIRLYTCAAFPFILTEDGELLRSKHCKGFGTGEVVNQKKMKAYLQKWRKKAGLNKI